MPSGWDPNRREAIAGAIQYREYDPFTDWQAVELLGHELTGEFARDQKS